MVASRHLPSQLSPHADKPVAPTEGFERDDGNAGLTGMSLDDTPRRFVPEDSKAALSMKKRKVFAGTFTVPVILKGP